MGPTLKNPLSIRRECAVWAAGAFAVRLLFFFITPQVIDSADSILYLEAAQKIADGHAKEVYPRIPLLYSVLTAIASKLTSDVETAALVVSLIAGTAVVVPLFLLSYRLHGRSAARIATLTATLWPWLVDYSCRVAPEMLYAMFWFGAVWSVLAAVRGAFHAWAILPFLLLGLYHSRPEGILLVVAILAAGMLPGRDKMRSAKRLLSSVVLLLVAIPVHILYMQRLAINAGIAPRLSMAAVHYSLLDRGEDVARTALRLAFITLPTMIGPVLGVLALVGIAAKSPRSRNWKMEIAVALVATTQFFAAALSTFAEPRYIMTTVIAISFWSARGAAILADNAAALPRRRALRFAPVALIVAMMLAGMYPNIVPPLLGEKSYKPLEYRIAGEWMKTNLKSGLILSRKPQVGYYANMPTSGPAPDDTLEVVHSRVLDAQMRYVVVDERYSTQLVPALAPLLDPANAPSWLRLLKSDLSPYADARIVIYEVIEDAPSS